MNPFKNKHWIGIRREPKGEEDRRVPFWTKQENAARHGGRLRGWRATVSNGDT